MILRLLRLTADLSDEPKWYYTVLFTVDKNALVSNYLLTMS